MRKATFLGRLLACAICFVLITACLGATAANNDGNAVLWQNKASVYPETIYEDEAAMIIASGHRSEVGDDANYMESRYVADGYSVNGGKMAPFRDSFMEDGRLYHFGFFEPETAGVYEITVTYRYEVWLGNEWRAMPILASTRYAVITVESTDLRPPTLADKNDNRIWLSNESIYVGATVYLGAEGAQYDISTSRLGIGSTRYVPTRWALSGYDGTFQMGEFTQSVQPIRVGTYVYSVYFQLQEWDGHEWVNVRGKYDLKWTLFYVTPQQAAATNSAIG